MAKRKERGVLRFRNRNICKEAYRSIEENDAFLEGFDAVKKEEEREKESHRNLFGKQGVTMTRFPNTQIKKAKQEKILGDSNTSWNATQYSNTQSKAPSISYLGGDLTTDKDKSLFMDGFREEASKTQTKNPDAIEFGEDSEVYKILQDMGKRWYQADPEEQVRLHEEAEKVRDLARGGYIVKDRTEEIMDTMQKNAKTAKDVQALIKLMPSGPSLPFSKLTKDLLAPSAFLVGMVDHGPWDYKLQEKWRVPMNETATYGGYDLNKDESRNWLKWMYFDGHLLGADKVGNMNMSYVCKKMGLPEWVYKNRLTMDKDDGEWVERGISLAEAGR